MGRFAGVATGFALASLLASVSVCAAANARGLTLDGSRPDLASQLMLRLFEETSDATAALAAQGGDRNSESPLRGLGLRVAAAYEPGPGIPDAGASSNLMPAHIALASLSRVDSSYLAAAADAGLLAANAQYALPAASQPIRAGSLDTRNVQVTAAYQPVAPVLAVSPDPGTIAFDAAPSDSSVSPVSGDALRLDADATQRRPGLHLSFSGQYERAPPGDAFGTGPASGASTWQLPSATVPLGPSDAGIGKLSIGAGLAVPVLRGLTFNLNYDAQRTYGGYPLPGLVNLDAATSAYIGRLTYDIPSLSSSLSISAYQNHLGESILPVNGYTQTGEDVNFTVKF